MEVTSSIDIARDADDVFAYLADMSNNPQWQGGQQRCEWTSPPPHGLGSTYDQEARFLGKTIVSAFEVVEYEPGRVIRIKTTGGTMPIDVTRTVRPTGDRSTRVEAIVRGDPPRWMAMLGPVMRRMVQRSVRQDYEQLKTLLEA